MKGALIMGEMQTKYPFALLLTITLIAATFVPSAIAQTEIPSAGITPDSPLYPVKIAIEHLQLMLTFNNTEKVKLHLQFAGERLAELQQMTEKHKFEYTQELCIRYENHINQCVALAGNNTALCELIAITTAKHQVVLERVYGMVPDYAKSSIQKAINVSKTGQEQALMNIEKEQGHAKAEEVRRYMEEARKEQRGKM
jgi:putative alpha-1,2-mannosidase